MMPHSFIIGKISLRLAVQEMYVDVSDSRIEAERTELRSSYIHLLVIIRSSQIVWPLPHRWIVYRGFMFGPKRLK